MMSQPQKRDKMCVSCCLPFSITAEAMNKSINLLSQINQFTNLMSFNPPKTSGAGKRKATMTAFSNDSLTSILVCFKCVSSFHSVLSKKREVVEIEGEVRRLQESLLQLLRSLQEKIVIFTEEVNRVEEIAEDAAHRTDKFNDYFSSGAGQSISFVDVVNFRGRILKVTEDLGSFRSELGVDGHVSQAHVDIVAKTDDPLKEEDLEDEDDSTPVLTEQETDPNLELDPDLDRYHNENNDEMSDDGDDDYITENECTDTQTDIEDDEKATSTATADPDSDKKSTSKRSKYNWGKLRRSLLSTLKVEEMSPFKKSLVSYVVGQNVRAKAEREGARAEGRPRSTATTKFDDVDPIRKHGIIYNPDTGTLDLCGMKIEFLEDLVRPLQCSDCGHKFKVCKDMIGIQRMIYGHIFGEHLKLLKCPQCPANYSTYNGFRLHVLGHDQDPSTRPPTTVTCDICGKPLHPQSLRAHKWSHMNFKEKAEARRLKGLEPLEIPEKYPKHLKPYQCAKCGKSFNCPGSLKSHEATHEEQRKMHMCESCGKSWTKISTLNYHRKYKCLAEEGIKQPISHFSCAHCPKNFPLRSWLNQHMFKVHSKDKYSWECGICEKRFINRSSLKYHMVAHSDARPFSCGKGCGATFKDKRNMRKHQIKCTATNTDNLS